jgi:hypothetical protein
MMAGVSNISLFAPQMADIERQRQMAEMLQQQANAPIEIQSYRGIQAPIPTTAVLAKALQGFAAARRRGQADTAERILRQKEEDIRKSEAEAVARAYETGEFVPPKVDKTAPEMPSAPESRAMQIAKALGLGGVANRMRGLVPGQQPVAPQDPNVPNFAGIPYAQGPEAPPSVAPPVAPPMAMPAIGAYNPQSGFGLSGIAPSPAAMPPVAPAVAAPPVAPPVAPLRAAPTLQDRQRAYYQTLANSRDPSTAISARENLMRIDQEQASNQAISAAMGGNKEISSLLQAGLSPGDAVRMYSIAKDNGYEIVTPGDGYAYVVDPANAGGDDRGVIAKIGEGKAMSVPTASQTATMPRVSNESEYNSLPTGASYIDPQGNIRRKS